MDSTLLLWWRGSGGGKMFLAPQCPTSDIAPHVNSVSKNTSEMLGLSCHPLRHRLAGPPACNDIFLPQLFVAVLFFFFFFFPDLGPPFPASVVSGVVSSSLPAQSSSSATGIAKLMKKFGRLPTRIQATKL